MTSAGDNLIESTARTLLRERIEATPWFRIKMTQEQRRAAIEREVDAYWHLFIADATQRLLGPGEANPHSKHLLERSGQRKSAPQGSASKVPAVGAEEAGGAHQRARATLVPSGVIFSAGSSPVPRHARSRSDGLSTITTF
jgi:hypothetical protein